MKRQEARNKALALKKKIKKASVGEIEKFILDIDKAAEDRIIQTFRKELHKQLGIGPKRFAKILYEVMKKLEGEN